MIDDGITQTHGQIVSQAKPLARLTVGEETGVDRRVGMCYDMKIFHDHSYVSQADKEFIFRGYACESFYSLRFSFV